MSKLKFAAQIVLNLLAVMTFYGIIAYVCLRWWPY